MHYAKCVDRSRAGMCWYDGLCLYQLGLQKRARKGGI